MPTLERIRKDLLKQLRQAGIDAHEAAREVDLIVEHATGYSLAKQLLLADHPIDVEALKKIKEIGDRRMERVPLQYLLGEQWFMGMPFKVRPGVLIPRADTETLVETALAFLKDLPEPKLIDIGTGSGAIVVSLLKCLPKATAYAVDISEQALACAQENAELNGVQSRLQLVRSDWIDFAAPCLFDAILCNPPYVPLSTAPELQPEVAVFEPKEAIFGIDEDGLGFYRSLSAHASRLLRAGGVIVVEVGAGQAESVRELFQTAGWFDVQMHFDLNGIARCISAFHAVEPIEK